MQKRRDILFFALPVLSDLPSIVIAFVLAYWVRFQSDWTEFRSTSPLFYYLWSSVFVVVVWEVVFYLSGLYEAEKTRSFAMSFMSLRRGRL